MDLETRWERFYRRHIGRPTYLNLTPTQAALSHELSRGIRLYISGRVLDAGAGALTYAFLLVPAARQYLSVDIDLTDPRLSARADICRLPFATGTVDTIFCSQVLEHVARPRDAMREFARVLRPGGTLLLTVPHLAYQHGMPDDYYRYTEFGLAHLAMDAGLEIREIRPAGGFLCFVAEPFSIILNATFGSVPVLSHLARVVNALFVRLVVGLDGYVGLRGRYPVNWVAAFGSPDAKVPQPVANDRT